MSNMQIPDSFWIMKKQNSAVPVTNGRKQNEEDQKAARDCNRLRYLFMIAGCSGKQSEEDLIDKVLRQTGTAGSAGSGHITAASAGRTSSGRRTSRE
ncbi:MAG: hypothetical protein ACLR8L_16195 [Oscillospiraceae bacterium]